MTKNSKCYAKIFCFSKILPFAQTKSVCFVTINNK